MVVRLTWRTPRELADVLTQLRRDHPKMPLAAWEVGSVEDFNLAKQHGAAVFSGGFVTRRGDWSANQLSPHMLNVAMLVSQVREDVDIHEMARVLKQDVAMSYRLLRYVNTAGGRLSQPVASIEQGLVLMGQAQLDRWLTLLMLSGNTAGGTALMETALTRARFLELLGEGRLPVEQCELLFVLGLFSMLDVALRVPLETAIKPLQLPELLNRALLHREGRYGQYLLLAEACERGQLDHVFKHAMAAGLNTAKVNARHWAALEWVAGMSNDADEGAAKS